jgi:hypothetical protein
MEKMIEGIMAVIETNLKKEGKTIDARSRNMIKESLKNQLSNLPEERRNEVLGLLATQIKI